jgi:hypothetical protein
MNAKFLPSSINGLAAATGVDDPAAGLDAGAEDAGVVVDAGSVDPVEDDPPFAHAAVTTANAMTGRTSGRVFVSTPPGGWHGVSHAGWGGEGARRRSARSRERP